MKFLKKIILLVLVSASAFSVYAQKKVKDTFLNKKTYLIEVTMQGGKKQKIFSEELNFASGKIKTKHLAMEEKFLQGDYEVTKVDSSGEAKSIDFKGSCKNDKDDYIIIQGTVFGNMIDGTIRWETSKKKLKSEMTFTGSAKEKGQKFVASEKTVANPSSNQKAGSGKEASPSKSSGKKGKNDNLDDDILNDDFD